MNQNLEDMQYIISDLRRELDEARRQQTATAGVLKVISKSVFDLKTVLGTLIESAVRLCDSDCSNIFQRDGDVYRLVSSYGFSDEYIALADTHPLLAGGNSTAGRVAFERRPVQVLDVLTISNYAASEYQRLGGYRTLFGVPLLRNGEPIGVLMLGRFTVRAFTERQIELVQTFADQAVIAIENARLFTEVEARRRELSETLELQTATSEVLRVISRSAFDLQTVLDTLVQSAARLCGADQSCIFERDGDLYRWLSGFGFSDAVVAYAKANPFSPGLHSATSRVARSGKVVHIPDVLADPEYTATEHQRLGQYRTMLGAPLMREGAPIGVFTVGRMRVEPFNERQIELVRGFSDQAVIAIENARLFAAVEARTQELTEALDQQTATAEVLQAISRSAFDLRTVLDTLLSAATRLCRIETSALYLLRDGHLHLEAWTANRPEWVAYKKAHPQPLTYDVPSSRAALTGVIDHVPDILLDPQLTRAAELNRIGGYRATLNLPLMRQGAVVGVLSLARNAPGAFSDRQIELIKIFADQAVIAIENVRLFEQLQARTHDLAQSLNELRSAQDRLIHTEKLASLGQLTAGIAHEIKNPLNFVNNFAALSGELVDELREVLQASPLDDRIRGDVDELADLLKSNLIKVVQHGQRADSIVKNMLLHSRTGSGEHRLVEVNSLVEESLNLAYHGARAERPDFKLTLSRELDPAAGVADLYPQEITRVLLNLIGNGFYAVAKRQAENAAPDFEPALAVITRDRGAFVEIRVRDNGIGIPEHVRTKMFDPFFTTKPAGEGTGLGLSLSHDIVVKQHGGTIDVATETGRFTEFTIVLPRGSATSQRPESLP
jgi:two-component system, NtrC family, sensor kinase